MFVDANVWFSRTRRDWLGLLYTLAEDPPFQVYWTEDVLAELIHSLRKHQPEWSGARITQIRDRLAGVFEVGRVEDFTVDGSYRGRDQHDAHVHAAALACRAELLITCNTTDFQWDANASPYEVLSPDDFFLLVDDAMPGLVLAAAKEMTQYWLGRNGEANLPQQLRTAECPRLAERVRQHLVHDA